MADDLAQLSRKMQLMRKQDESLLDIDGITAQVSTARPIGGKSCQEHCNLAMHISCQVKLANYEKEAVQMREVAQAESDDDVLINMEEGFSQEQTWM